MKIYLDTNVIIDFYNGDFKDILSALLNLKLEGVVEIPFSSTHVEEISDLQNGDRKKEIATRLAFLSKLSSDLYFCNDMLTTSFKVKSPNDVYNTLNDLPIKIDYKSLFANFIPFDTLKNGRYQLGLDPQYLNNIAPENAINEIDKYLFASIEKYTPNYSGEITVKRILKKAFEISEDAHSNSSYHSVISKKKSYLTENIIVMLFSLLDSLGFWSDKKSVYSRGSRFGDCFHCFNGSYCSYIISNDLRFCKKALAVYKYLDYNTAVLHFQSNQSEIKEILKVAI